MSEMGDMKFTTAGDMMKTDYDELVKKYDNDAKLDIAAWVISKINEHGVNPGSFRHLIYGGLGFGPEAYVPLYEAGGMNITNELDYARYDDLIELVKEEKIDNVKLKNYLSICDEPSCFEHASCGWPSEPRYRRTCHAHSNFTKQENGLE